MTYKLTLEELKNLRTEMRAQARAAKGGIDTAAWWCLSGYADILARAIREMEAHHRRALKIYKDRAR